MVMLSPGPEESSLAIRQQSPRILFGKSAHTKVSSCPPLALLLGMVR